MKNAAGHIRFPRQFPPSLGRLARADRVVPSTDIRSFGFANAWAEAINQSESESDLTFFNRHLLSVFCGN